MQTTIIDVKFDKEFESEKGSPSTENREIAKNLLKNEEKFLKIAENWI